MLLLLCVAFAGRAAGGEAPRRLRHLEPTLLPTSAPSLTPSSCPTAGPTASLAPTVVAPPLPTGNGTVADWASLQYLIEAGLGASGVFVAGAYAITDKITVYAGDEARVRAVGDGAAVFDGSGSDKRAFLVSGSLELVGPLVVENLLLAVAGACAKVQNGGVLTATDVAFRGNAGSNGVAVYATGQAAVFLTSCAFLNNVATSQGGAIYASDAYVSLVGINATRNTGEGGFLYATSASLIELRSSLVAENVALTNGGGFLLTDASTLRASNSTFARNVADEYAGAVAAEAGSIGTRARGTLTLKRR
jgi:predicted outer membrane repeat protein